MSRKNMNTNPLPQRESEPVYSSQGTETEQALNFLRNLSDQSRLQISTPKETGIETYSGSYNGKEVSEGIKPADEEGYLVAIYDWKDTEDMTVLPKNELYIAFSKDLPKKNDENPELGEGAIIEGEDEGTSTQRLKRLGEKHLE